MMAKQYLIAIIFALVSLWPLGCSRKDDAGNKAVVRITMPDRIVTESQAVSFSVNAPGGWSITDPSTLNDILCYAVAVQGPEPVMSKYSCTQIDGTEVMSPSLFGGPVTPNETVTMEIPSGSERTFYIIGFGATSEQDCLDFTLTGIPPREKLSAPHIIGTKVVDLVPGELDLDINISMTGATKFNECEGPFFNPDPAEITISDGPTYDYGDRATGSITDHTFTLENIGGSSATSVSEVGLAAPYSLKGGAWPGTGGTCGTTIASAEICTIVVEYAPTVIGTPTDIIIVSFNDGYDPATSERALTAIASAPAFLSISDGPTYDYGSSTVQTLTAEHTFTITNTGSYVATSIVTGALTAPFNYKGGTYPGTGGDCSTSLASLAVCTIVVEFTPPSAILYTDTISFTYIDGAFPAGSSRNIQGTGATPASLAIDLGPTFDYGTKATGSTTTSIFTVTNSGDTDATSVAGTGIAAPYTYKGGTYPGTGGTCGNPIPTGSCTIVVDYDPSTVAVHNDQIDINYFDGLVAQTASRPVTGTGANPANLTISEVDPYDYGNVYITTSADHTFTITNSGGVPATSMAFTGLAGDWDYKGGVFPGTGGDCGTSLTNALTCDVVITFTPSSSGLSTETIDLNYYDGAAAQLVSRNMQATGQTQATLAISEINPYDYGTVVIGNTVSHTFTVTNLGDVSATSVGGSGLAGDWSYTGGTYPGTNGTCGTTIASGAPACDVVVSFTPSAGFTSDSISIDYNSGLSNLSALRIVQGTGQTPALLTISDGPTYNFGATSTGVAVYWTFTVTNSGQTQATSITDIGPALPYQYRGGVFPGAPSGTCGTTLNGGGSTCFIEVEFNPGTINTFPDTLQIDYNNGVATQSATRAVTGDGI